MGRSGMLGSVIFCAMLFSLYNAVIWLFSLDFFVFKFGALKSFNFGSPTTVWLFIWCTGAYPKEKVNGSVNLLSACLASGFTLNRWE